MYIKQKLLNFGLTAVLAGASIILLFAFASLATVSSATGTYTANVAASVSVPTVCGQTLGASLINFGSIAPGANVPTANSISDTNTGGTSDATMLVEGTDWTGTPGSFGVSNTLWNPTTLGTYTGNALTNGLVSTGITITGGGSSSIYFGLGIPIGTGAGSYTQNIIIENTC